jgi:dTDP-4-dehydrorhamnose reductase
MASTTASTEGTAPDPNPEPPGRQTAAPIGAGTSTGLYAAPVTAAGSAYSGASAIDGNVLITGATGQLGRAAVAEFVSEGWDVFATDAIAPTVDDGWPARAEFVAFDLEDASKLAGFIATARPWAVIHCAAMTNVPGCETDPSTAYRLNAVLPAALARQARAVGAHFVHISTDYVFDGAATAPYGEDDATAPLQHYGASKRAGESLVLAEHPGACIVRVSGLYGHNLCQGKGAPNFIEQIIAKAQALQEGEGGPLRLVADEITAPTYARDVAERLPLFVEALSAGVYHLTNAGSCSWYDFARFGLSLAGLTPEIEPVSQEAFASPVRRPRYSVLDNAKVNADAALAALGFEPMRPWEAALAEYIALRSRVA